VTILADLNSINIIGEERLWIAANDRELELPNIGLNTEVETYLGNNSVALGQDAEEANISNELIESIMNTKVPPDVDGEDKD